MKTNSDTPRTMYIGLDVHKEKTSIALLESYRDAEPRVYGEINTTQHALAFEFLCPHRHGMMIVSRFQQRCNGCGLIIQHRI